MEVHPLCEMFPELLDDDLANLSADIATKGQMEPIVIYQGKILDGRNRYKVLKSQGKAVKEIQYQGKDPAGFVISRNIRRRHLSAKDRADIEVRVRSWAAPHRPNGHSQPATVSSDEGSVSPVFTNAQMAEEAGVSERTISRAKQQVEEGDKPKAKKHKPHPGKAAMDKVQVLQMELDGAKEQIKTLEEANVQKANELTELEEKAKVILADEPTDSIKTKIWNEAAHATAEKAQAVSSEAKLQTILTERNKALRRMDQKMKAIKRDLEALLPNEGVQKVLEKHWQ